MSLRVNSSTMSQNTYMKAITVNREEADKIITESENANERTILYNAMNIGKNNYATLFGTTIESKYGYAAEFDSVSRNYAEKIISHNYAEAAEENVVSNMEDKYQSLKKEIEENYSGNEKEERLLELNKTYDFIMNANVIGSIDLMLKNENALNKLRTTFAKAYKNAKQTKSSEFVRNAYGSMKNWLAICNDIDKQLNLYKEMFEKLKESMKNIHTEEGAASYADSLLKGITTGLSGVEEKKMELGKEVQNSSDEKVKNIWSLIENKYQTFFRVEEAGKNGSEKYQIFLKDAKQIEGIDQKLSELLNELLGN